jgi:hypothetical protein
MVTISNVDLVMAALRSRLQRIAGDKRPGRASAQPARPSGRSAGREPIQALAAMRGLPPEDFDRALIRAVLEMELGEAISEDPRFHRLVEQTHTILQEDPDIKRVLRQIQLGRT